ncbi:MAG: hypothetical protein KatS3mg123_2387 [Burkholderiales bacterium]|nr:MAG: hypothetical protein KatS3mg123_2387 [Burkholderiales bacterium]
MQDGGRGKQRGDAFRQLPAGAAHADQVARHGPGGDPQKQRPGPAGVDVLEEIAPLGLHQEGDHGGQHQDRFQPFPQQDDEGGHRRRRGREHRRRRAALAARASSASIAAALRSTSATGRARAQEAAVGHHGGFHFDPQIPCHRVKTRLGELEALEIGGDRQPLGPGPVAAPVGVHAFREQPAALGDGRARRRDRPPRGGRRARP